MKKTEARQRKIMEYLKNEYSKNGYAPTVREICAALDIRSTSTVHNDIKVLEEQGYIRKHPSKPRTLIPCDISVNKLGNVDIRNNADSVNNVRNGNNNIDTVELPVIGRVAAGVPILSEENIDDYYSFPARFIGPGENFILNVHGDSMINAGINDGDYIIVNQDKSVQNGDIVVAMIDGEYESESTVKRYYKEKGHIRLQPENDEMGPIIVDECTIIGKVKAVFRYLS